MKEPNEPNEGQPLFEKKPEMGLARNAPVDAAIARATQEVQAAMVIAKKFPRDEAAAYNRITRACKRLSLAEVATYAYPRGGTTVTGPSIRLAECLAQNWGNIDFGVVELGQANGESQVFAFAWDLETNTRQSMTFTVKHERRVGRGENFAVVELSDPRDIYEMVANQGARRLRKCILGIIPGDIVDSAVDACERTLKEGSKEPIQDRARKMIAAFSEMGVTQQMIEQRIGHKVDALNEQELVNLRRIYTSLKDGAAKREDFFAVEATEPNFDKATPEAEPTAESKPKTEPKPATLLDKLRGRMVSAHVEEAQLLRFMREMGMIDDTLSSLEQVEQMAPTAIKTVYDGWSVTLKHVREA